MFVPVISRVFRMCAICLIEPDLGNDSILIPFDRV